MTSVTHDEYLDLPYEADVMVHEQVEMRVQSIHQACIGQEVEMTDSGDKVVEQHIHCGMEQLSTTPVARPLALSGCHFKFACHVSICTSPNTATSA